MRSRLACALLSVSLLASACGTVYRVRDAHQQPLDGVPFFPHVGVCRHETSYIQPLYRVAVQTVAGSREIVLFEASVTGAAVASAELRELRSAVMTRDVDPARLAEAFNALTRAAGHLYDPQAPPVGLFIASDTASAEAQVDYGTPLFMNASRPWIGSAEASARIAPDGTLSEATAEVKDTTADALLGMVPARELLTAVAPGARIGALAGTGPDGAEPVLQMLVAPQFVRHTYTTLAPAPCLVSTSPIPPGAPGAMYRRELLAPPPRHP